jgi:hypothetical protein
LLFVNEVRVFNAENKTAWWIFRFSFFALFVKYIFQLISVLPDIGNAAFLSREVMIGFIHLVMLGVISMGIIGWFCGVELLNGNNKLFITGLSLFAVSFAFSEVLLFYPALVIWFKISGIPDYTMYMFVLSIGMLAGIIAVFISSFRGFKN